MKQRTLGNSGIKVSPVGLGCWAIGGHSTYQGKPIGWSQVDDGESVRAIHRAMELGINFLDTSNSYGCGHSEEVIAKAISGKRGKVIIATKFGGIFDAEKRELIGKSSDVDDIRPSCEASLRRLKTDYIDLYQFHVSTADNGAEVREELEKLVTEGKIRGYGWSTDFADRARIFAVGNHCCAIQQRLNVVEGNYDTLRVCEEYNLASINRSPLGMGILTGKFDKDTKFPEDDLRRDWNFKKGEQAEWLDKFNGVRDIIKSDGRTLAQGSLCWLLAKSEVIIPTPGFKTIAQIEENARAMDFSPLTLEQMKQMDHILDR